MRAAAQAHCCDVIVSASMGNTHALDVAEKDGLLCFTIKFCPDIDGQIPTGAFAPSGYPSGMLGPLNYVAHVLENLRTVGSVFAGGFIPRVIEFRKMLGFQSMKIDGQGLLPVRVMDDIDVPTYSSYRTVLQANQPCLYAFSEALVDRPPEYKPWHFMIGSMGKTDTEKTLELPSGICKFLEAAEAKDGLGPICIAFGSMTLARSSPWQSRAIVESRRFGLHVIVVDPQGLDGVMADDPHVYVVRSVPYSVLFKRCRLVVHHGGAGTLQDCLWAGTPQLVAPVLSWSDQPFWGSALEQKGLGLALGPGGVPPEAEDWEGALSRALSRLEEFRSRAETIALQAEGERGAAAACEVLEEAMFS